MEIPEVVRCQRIVLLVFFIIMTIGSHSMAQEAAADAEGADEPSLEEKVEVLTEEISRLREQMNIPESDAELHSAYGLGPAASKVYGVSQGMSFGGYGEFYFAAPYDDTDATGKVNTTDFYRFITYVGYKFNDRIIMNAEIEYEHATTSSNYEGQSGSISVEFAYLDFLIDEGFNLRAGNILVPVGFLNLVHEPPTYWGNIRPTLELTIIPTTWREMGVGAHGEINPFTYSAYVLNGFNASRFDSEGIRGGRQKANRAIWEDVGAVVAVEYHGRHTLRAGGSAYFGGADQGLVAGSSGGTLEVNNQVYEAHAEYRHGGFRMRALASAGRISNAGELSFAMYADSSTVSEQVPESQFGWYVEAGYDVATLFRHRHSFTLTPWARYEVYNLQESVSAATGLPADPALDGTLLTVGLEGKPHPNVVVKLDWVHPTNQSGDPTSDEIRLGAGFIY
jgi:hypothetical protein